MSHYALGLGANRARPKAMIRTAIAALETAGLAIVAASPIIETRPIGPGRRRYANAALLVESDLPPPVLLVLAKRIERTLGRRPGRRWGDRAIDIDLLLWRGGPWRTRTLTLPHAALAQRRFALDPLMVIAGDWPAGPGTRVRHLHARLTAARPLHRETPLVASP